MAPAAVVFSLGFFALVAQTLLFREFLTAFEGNELGIGCFFGAWLLWVALGAVVGRRAAPAAKHFESLALFYIPAFIAQQLLIDNARALVGVASYELFPFGRMALWSLLTNAPVSFLTGFLFTLACTRWADFAGAGGDRKETGASPVAQVYILETLGGFLGGVAATLMLTYGIPAITIFAWTSLLLAAATATVPRGGLFRFAPLAAVAIALAAGVPNLWTEAASRAAWSRLLPADAYQARFVTAQAKYAFGRNGNQFVVISAGGVCESLPNTEHASEIAALNLAQIPNASSILVAGPDSLSLCLRLMEVPQVQAVTWLHPDPEYPSKLMEVLPQPFREAAQALEIPGTDARAFLETSQQRYDLIILNLPDATTLVLNRYFTQEFFALLDTALEPGGAVSLRISGAANYLGGELAYLGASALATLTSVFDTAVLKPGDESWIIASNGPSLTESPAILRDRFAAIEGAAALYPPEALLSLYLPDRIAFQKEKYRELAGEAAREVLINRDDKPRALLFSLLTALRRGGMKAVSQWLPTVFAGGLWILACPIIAYGLLRALYLLKSSGNGSHSALFDSQFLILSTGLAGISLSIVLMFLYQSRFGTLFLHVGLVNALFMLGSFLGGLFSERQLTKQGREPRLLLPALVLIHVVLLLSIMLLPGHVPRMLFGLLFTLSGVFTGIYFPIAAHRLHTANRDAAAAGSRLEMLDHLGGALGGAATGLILLPLFGTQSTLALLGLLVAVNLVGVRAPQRMSFRGDRFDTFLRPAGYTLFGIGAVALAASQIVVSLQAGQQGQRFLDAARVMTGAAQLVEEHATKEDGGPFTYYLTVDDQTDAAFLYNSAQLTQGIYGYGGPITVAAVVDQEAVLRDFRIVNSKETPAYLELLQPWTKKLLNRSLALPDTFREVDAVSGATLTADALKETLQTSGRAFASLALHLDVETATLAAVTPLLDRGFLCLAALTILAVIVRLRPGRWRRRAVLLAAILLSGFFLNVQYSTQHIFSLLSLNLPELRLSEPFFVVVLVPLLVLLTGNLYCGYMCPFGALQELLGDLRPATLATDPGKNIWRYGRFVKYLLLLLLVLLFALTRDYAVLAADPLTTVFSPIRDAATLAMALGILALSVVYRRFWCRNLCPAGAFLSLLNGVPFIKKLVPPSRPHCCDLGLRSPEELDCLRCGRCWHEQN